MGLQGFVYNMDWTRIFPKNSTDFNPEVLKFYDDVFKTLLENGVNLIEFYLNKLNKKNEKEYNYYFKNEDKHNQQFLINKNFAHQAQTFV